MKLHNGLMDQFQLMLSSTLIKRYFFQPCEVLECWIFHLYSEEFKHCESSTPTCLAYSFRTKAKTPSIQDFNTM